jgi:hypothetical protein
VIPEEQDKVADVVMAICEGIALFAATLLGVAFTVAVLIFVGVI